MSVDCDSMMWVRDLLQKEYDKIAFDEEEKIHTWVWFSYELLKDMRSP
jgi:hypothetical protein